MKFKKYEDKGTYHWEDYEKNSHYREKTDKIVELVGEGKKVLDAGCGDGLITDKIGKNNYVVGIDNSKEAIKLAKQKCSNVDKLKEDNALDLSFKDNTFDVVVLADVIEHIKQEQELLKEMHRVTKKNGEIIITTPLKRKDSLLWDPNNHVKEYSTDDLEKSVSNYYNIIDIELIETKGIKDLVRWIGGEVFGFLSKRILPLKIYRKLGKFKTILLKGKKK